MLEGISTALSFAVKDPELQLFLADAQVSTAALTGWIQSVTSRAQLLQMLDQQQRYTDVKQLARDYADLVRSLLAAKQQRANLAARTPMPGPCSD